MLHVSSQQIKLKAVNFFSIYNSLMCQCVAACTRLNFDVTDVPYAFHCEQEENGSDQYV